MNNTPTPRSHLWAPVLVLSLDLALIILFAGLGRDTHEHGLDPAGILITASPFLAACLAGWALLRAGNISPAALWPGGVILWVVTVTAGLGIRALAGGGVVLSFALVTVGVLGAFLLLPRAVAALARRARRGGLPRSGHTDASDRLGNKA